MMVVPTLRQKFRVVIIRPRPCQVDQEHQISQNLGDAISERFASVNKKHWTYEPEKFGNIKQLHEKLLIPQNCGEICTPKLNREIFCNNNIPR